MAKKVALTVFFYAMRHGDKDGDRLTQLGQRQVRAATNAHLANRGGVDLIYYSGMNRTKQTTIEVLEELDQSPLEMFEGGDVRVDEAFGYLWATDDPNCPQFVIDGSWGKKVKETTGERRDTIYDWMESGYKPVWACRGRVMESLLRIAKAEAEYFNPQDDDNEMSVLIASHSPVAESACLNPREMPRLGPADICLYTVKVYDDDTAAIVSSEYLPCPSVE